MTVKDTVTKSLLEYPLLFLNSLDVYNHLFCTIGNGYDWIDGELVDTCSSNEKVPTIKKAIQKIIEREIKDYFIDTREYWIDEMLGNGIDSHTKEAIREKINEDFEISNRIIKENLTDSINLILDLDYRYKDFSIYTKDTKRYKSTRFLKNYIWSNWRGNEWKWHIYPLCIEYSYLCNFPDDIKFDWAIAIDKMCWFIEKNLDEVMLHRSGEEYELERKTTTECLAKAHKNLHRVIDSHDEDEWKSIWDDRKLSQIKDLKI